MKVIILSGKARNGKTETANIIKEQLELEGFKPLKLAYGDYLKDICKRLANWNGEKNEVGRAILQQTGTNIVREKLHMSDLWVNHVINEVKIAEYLGYTHIIIDDARFKNELYIPKANFYDCVTVRVERLGFKSDLTDEQLKHRSETELDNEKFD